ncbi:AAA family ATPase [Saccharopolyspora indica]|uniref:AAA family ATPase n=1 Tax=Saccharopolyspora indica TaxID=1229659 RepID=UPI0022EB1906|nr:AAA family ATPase [Saccharopolyspora indica]MDA3643810.1 AAA family ATPase [Saccharopolyspora indica]
MSSRVEAVQDYLNRGWTPFLYESEFNPGSNWQNSKAEDIHLDVVRNSDSPVALLLGKASGIVAIDIDVQNGGSAEALFKKYGEQIKDTRVHKTASGGWHLLFRYPESIEDLKGIIDAGKWVNQIGPGIDFLGDRRHVQAPPTVRVGHPKKPNGSYKVLRDQDPAPLPEALLRDWLSVIGDRPANGIPIEKASPLQYKRLLDLHHNNVQAARDAMPGTLDNTFYARLASSMRIARVLPDEVLSYDDVEASFGDMPYPVRDFAGKAQRAREFAQSNPWEELTTDEFNIDIPPGVAPEDLWEYLMQLRKRRVQTAVQDQITKERIEREASKVSLPDFEVGDDFLSQEIDAEEWLIEGLLHHQGKALLSAQMKSGKSTMMLEIIRSLTSGTEFLGRFRVPKPLTVAFYDMELGRSMAQRWLRDIEGADFNRLHYVSLLGRGNAVDMRSRQIREATARRLSGLGVDVLVVDPVSPVLSALGISENDSESVRPFLDSFDQLAVEAGLSGVIITAHTGHENKSRARGSTAFGDWPTALWNIQREGETQDSPRSFAAYGRDVNVPRGALVFHDRTRGYTFEGGSFDHITQQEYESPFSEVR